jgi:ATP-dependent Clp protease protease subunit
MVMTNLPSGLIIPSVIESSGRGEYHYDIYSLLLKERIIFLGTAIDNNVANVIVAQLLYLAHQDSEREISLYIHSPGGIIYAGLAIYDTMQLISPPVSTIAVGATASMGTVLLAGGTKGRRFALPNATIHMHPAGGGVEGYAPDVEIQARELLRMQAKILDIMVRHTGQPLDRISLDFDRDHYLDAPAAVEYGIVDSILNGPEAKKLSAALGVKEP